MSKLKAVATGGLIWLLGAVCYTISYLVPVLDNPDLQANLVLGAVAIPNVWFGTHFYYIRKGNMHWLQLGVIILLTAICLDAMITVPFFIIPTGGSFQGFFGAPAFWLITAEVLLVVFAYWYFKGKKSHA